MTTAAHWHEAQHAVTCASLYADRVVEAVWSERWRDACSEELECETALIDALTDFLCGLRCAS